jgi:hypothetical protein
MLPQPDYSPAADRNKQVILDMLMQVLPERGNALEIASGTGQHVAWFASTLSGWNWQPSDAQPDGFESINAWAVAQDPAWGIRRIEDVAQVAAGADLRLHARHAMPANNLLLTWTTTDQSL